MKKQFLSLLALVALAGQGARAEDVNINEKPDTVRVSLSPYSVGFGGGVITPLNTELRNESESFLKLSFLQSITFQDHWNMNLDVDWALPHQNWGGDLSLDYLIATDAFRPFIGAGGGFRYFDKPGSNFGQNIGASGTVHIGMLLDVMDEMQLRIRIPIHFVANDAGDRAIGLDVGVLFGSPLRTTHVRKLKYP